MKDYLKKVFSMISLLFFATLRTSAQKFTINGITFMTIRNLVDQKEKKEIEQEQGFTDVIVTNIPKLYNDKDIKNVISNDLPLFYRKKLYRILGVKFDILNQISNNCKGQNNNQPFVIGDITYTPIHNLISPDDNYIDVVITNVDNVKLQGFQNKFKYNQKNYKVIGIDEDVNIV